jgi:hypothetical protein
VGGCTLGAAPFGSSIRAGHPPSRSCLVPPAHVLAPRPLCSSVGGCRSPTPRSWGPASACARGPQLGLSALRSPHSQSYSDCGSWDWGSGRGCVCGCGSHDCDCCSSRDCGQGWGCCDCGSGLSSHCSGSWRKKGWAGSRGWDACGHCEGRKSGLQDTQDPELCPSTAITQAQLPSQQWPGLPASVSLESWP